MKFVLDASITLAWCFEDERDRYAESVLNAVARKHVNILVPVLWPIEVANALLTAQRRKRLTASAAMRFIAGLRELPIRIAPHPGFDALPQALELAREYDLTAYDALYLALALAEECPLATRDSALRAACVKGKVALFKP